jgi:uncharacterized protein HemX
MSDNKQPKTHSQRDVPTVMTIQNVVAILIVLGGLAAGYFAYDKRITVLESEKVYLVQQDEEARKQIDAVDARLRSIETQLAGIAQMLTSHNTVETQQTQTMESLRERVQALEFEIRDIRTDLTK